MKKLFSVLVLTLAVNFLAAAGGIAWLYQSGHLDRERLHAIREVVFPPEQAAAPATQPTTNPTPSAAKQLEELLAKTLGKGSAADQVKLIQDNYGQTMAQLDQRSRELDDRDRLVADASRKVVEDRKALDAERQRLAEREQLSDRQASDAGFQSNLSIYNKMAPKQVKAIFMTLDDDTSARFLNAMEPGKAATILKEYKTAPETERAKRLMEKMRKPETAAAGPVSATGVKE